MKKGQVKIQQMAFMMIALIIFFALVGMFLLSIGFSKIRGDAEMLKEKEALSILTKISNSPEFRCGDAYSGDNNCIDLDKVMALKTKAENYSSLWDVGAIELELNYPSGVDAVCDSVNYPECNKIIIYEEGGKNGVYRSNFVTLCRKEKINEKPYDMCYLGKIYVSAEYE